MTKVTQFVPDDPEGLTLGTGTYQIIVVVEDEWGATTKFTISEKVSVSEIVNLSSKQRDWIKAMT